MYATLRTMVIHSRAKHSLTKTKELWPGHKTMPCLEVNGQRGIRTMNVRNTSSLVINQCSQYGMQMSVIITGRIRKHDKTL